MLRIKLIDIVVKGNTDNINPEENFLGFNNLLLMVTTPTGFITSCWGGTTAIIFILLIYGYSFFLLRNLLNYPFIFGLDQWTTRNWAETFKFSEYGIWCWIIWPAHPAVSTPEPAPVSTTTNVDCQSTI